MKLFLTTFIATICYVSAGKRLRMLAAMNAGLIPGVNVANPGMMAGVLNPLMVAGGGAGFVGQPQFAQFVPGGPTFAVPGPVPNMQPVPAANVLSFMGIPQMTPMNSPQQPLVGAAGGAMPQQFPLQPDPLRRFRRQIMIQGNVMKNPVDTQIPAPTDTISTVCEEDDGHQTN